MQRLVEKLHRRVAELAEGSERECARAELAACLARHGQYPEATAVLESINRNGRWDSAALAVKIMFAEAMIRLRHELDPVGLDRLRRGHALATGARLLPLVVDFAAWLFHFNYNRNHFEEMDRWLRDCEALADSATPHARARLCLTIAAVTAYAADQTATDDWYRRGRRVASSIGDEAFLAAAMYNRPAFAISAARLELARTGRTSADLSQLMLEIESAENYANATANSSARFLQRLWKGRAFMLQGSFDRGHEAITSALDGMPEARHEQIESTLRLDIAICRRQLAQDSETLDADLSDLQLEGLGADDQVVAISQLRALGLSIEPSPTLRAIETSALATLNEQLGKLEAMTPRFAAFQHW